MAIFKTSVFANYQNSILHNDLTNRSYHYDTADIEMLRQLSIASADLESLTHSTQAAPSLKSRFEYLVQEKLLVPACTDEASAFVPHRIDIETFRQCNARCRYCPQSISQKTRGIMPMRIFNDVLNNLYSTHPQWIAFNHYGEPLLDPYFQQRIEGLREHGHRLRLFTNATLLTDSITDFLCQTDLYGVVFNFPSLDPLEWCQLMQLPEKVYWKARRGIEHFLSVIDEIPDGVTISVNAITTNQQHRAEQIADHFGSIGDVRIHSQMSHSRAGSIINGSVKVVENAIGGLYAGCKRFVGHLHVSWEGKVFQCCQDYEQVMVFGDLRTQSLYSIMASSKARQLRAEIFGLAPMQKNRLCLRCPMLRRTRFPINDEALPD